MGSRLKARQRRGHLSTAISPIPRPAPLIRHRQNPDQLAIKPVVQRVRKTIDSQLSAAMNPWRTQARKPKQQLDRRVKLVFECIRYRRPRNIGIPASCLHRLGASSWLVSNDHRLR